MKELAGTLHRLRRAHRYRSRRVLDGAQGPEIAMAGRRWLNFCSNDYLGLAADARVVAALRDGAARFGAGSGAAHLVCGHGAAHHRLEEMLADFTGRQRALLFSTGYMANLGVISALAGRGDDLLADRLCHASLLDGALLSRARLRRYPHLDAAALDEALARDGAGRIRLVITEGVFSMDGDMAPLAKIARQCRARDTWLMVDDAHGLGVLGPRGGGTTAHFGLSPQDVPVLVGTLGKALGTAGAFVAGDEDLVEYLIQHARTYLYTTALPPAVAHATCTSLTLARDEHWRRDRLQALCRRFLHGARQLDLSLPPALQAEPAGENDPPLVPIFPLLAGEDARALRWSEALARRGILVTAIRPPTVPEGSARLRITLSAAHHEEHVDRLLDSLAQLGRSLHES